MVVYLPGMTLKVTIEGGASKTVNGIFVTDETSADREINAAWFGVHQVYATGSGVALSVVISPTVIGAYSPGTAYATTPTVTATPSGGTAPYTYLWSIDSQTGGDPVDVNSPTTASTTFTQTGLAPGDNNGVTAACLVTDSLLASVSGTCSISFLGGS